VTEGALSLSATKVTEAQPVYPLTDRKISRFERRYDADVPVKNLSFHELTAFGPNRNQSPHLYYLKPEGVCNR